LFNNLLYVIILERCAGMLEKDFKYGTEYNVLKPLYKKKSILLIFPV